jgi:hypothetical protein
VVLDCPEVTSSLRRWPGPGSCSAS